MSRAVRALLGAVLLAMAGGSFAHKASDAYLQLDLGETTLSVRWDIALRDLDAALELDLDDDGLLTWAEVKTAWPRVEGYATPRLAIDGCTLRVASHALERRSDGAYAVLFLQGDCALAAVLTIRYSLLREVDPTHRGIAKIVRAGQAPELRMLDPLAPTGAAAPPRPGASGSTAKAPDAGFVRDGVAHILTGWDHVLFLLCLLVPSVMRRTPAGWQPVARLSDAVWPVVGIVSAFTVAHSITLALAAARVVSLSPAFIEPAIAVTIILAALDNVWPIFPVRRVVVTFCFGLVHGFGFAGVLAELNLPASAFAWALLQFNVGLELGQLLIVVSATALLFLLRQRPHYRTVMIGGGSLFAMLLGLLWLIERTANVAILPV